MAEAVTPDPIERMRTLEYVPPSSEVLYQVAAEIPLDEIMLPENQALFDRMTEVLLAEEYGAGLAAPQLGVSKRVILFNKNLRYTEDMPPQFVFLINPTVERESATTQVFPEGCYSLGPDQDVTGFVERPDAVRLGGYDRDGNEVHYDLEEYAAQVGQHERDHLDGVLFVDRISNPDLLKYVPLERLPEWFELGTIERKMEWPDIFTSEEWEARKAGADLRAA